MDTRNAEAKPHVREAERLVYFDDSLDNPENAFLNELHDYWQHFDFKKWSLPSC